MRLLSASAAKPTGGAVKGRDQRQFAGKLRAELLLIVGRRRPRLLLRLAVIVGGQFLDAGAENLGQQRHIRRQHRPHREFAACARAFIARSPRWCRLWCLSARRPSRQFVADAVGFFRSPLRLRAAVRALQSELPTFALVNRDATPAGMPPRTRFGRCLNLQQAESIARSPSGTRPPALPPLPLRRAIRAAPQSPSACSDRPPAHRARRRKASPGATSPASAYQ